MREITVAAYAREGANQSCDVRMKDDGLQRKDVVVAEQLPAGGARSCTVM
jgi:hypothetical protein